MRYLEALAEAQKQANESGARHFVVPCVAYPVHDLAGSLPTISPTGWHVSEWHIPTALAVDPE